ncbi:hypothetical protein [Clostridium sp. C2-6-12]|nr:hypothetical protein [Clostridium sp. C2-6-12]
MLKNLICFFVLSDWVIGYNIKKRREAGNKTMPNKRGGLLNE